MHAFPSFLCIQRTIHIPKKLLPKWRKWRLIAERKKQRESYITSSSRIDKKGQGYDGGNITVGNSLTNTPANCVVGQVLEKKLVFRLGKGKRVCISRNFILIVFFPSEEELILISK